MTIRELLRQDGPFTATGVGGQWAVYFVGPVSLTREGVERWSGVLGKECDVHDDGDGERIAVVRGIEDPEQRDEICALFNMAAGNVNAFTLAKYRELTTEEKSEDKEIRAMLAREIRRIAWLVVDGAVGSGDKGDDNEEPQDLDSMRKKIEAELAAAHDMITGSLAEYEKDYEKAKREYERAKRTLERKFEEFDKKYRWTGMIEACERKIKEYEKAGGKVKDIRSRLSVSSGESPQPSYKHWLQWVIGRFGADEFESYFRQLETFKKEQVSISAVSGAIVVKLKEWKDTAIRNFKDIGRRLPKASVRIALKVDFSDWGMSVVSDDDQAETIVSKFILQCSIECGVLEGLCGLIDEAVNN